MFINQKVSNYTQDFFSLKRSYIACGYHKHTIFVLKMIVFQRSFTWIDKQLQSSDQSSVKLQFWHSAPSKWGNLACQKSKFIANDQFLVITSNRTLSNKQNRLQDIFRCALWRPQYTKYCTSFLPPKSTQKKFPYKNFTYLRAIVPLP